MSAFGKSFEAVVQAVVNRLATVRCGTCNFVTSAKDVERAKAAMVDHLIHSHTAKEGVLSV